VTPRRIITAVVAAAVTLAVFIGGVVVGGHPEATGLTRLADPVRSWVLGDSGEDLSSQVLRMLRDSYYEDIDTGELESASVQGLLDALDDPYTTYLDAEQLAALRDHNEGAYVGVGIQVAGRNDVVVITRVFPDSPAAKAGLAAGDRVVAVDGVAARGGALDAAIARVRGPEGTAVTLTVRRPGERPREHELIRSRIKVPAVRSRVIASDGQKVGYLRLLQFTRGAADALRLEVSALIDKDVDGLVLDLREDPGGLVSEALGVAGVFLPEGTDVVTTQGRHSPRRTLRTSKGGVDLEIPLVVLVDRNSASSSEIVAGALRDADRAELVGERTFGKALVQSTRLLRDGGALKLTTARYLTPSGYDLAERGLPPDVRAVDDPATEPDEALDRAVEVLEDGAVPTGPIP